MTVEIRPLGTVCNLQCQYCYQHPQRDAGSMVHHYDLEQLKLIIEREGGSFTLFGGEALLIQEEDLEAFWAWGFEKYKQNGVQTNGVLINDNHIRMFKQYNVHVGVSMDGPAELNDARWAGTLERTREATDRTTAALERLCKENVACSLIVTLHRGNATRDKLPIMNDWFRYLRDIGIRSIRLHILEVENEQVRSKYQLSAQESIEAFLNFAELEKELSPLCFDIYKDMRQMLLGQDNQSCCIWNACDPYTTRAVRGIEGNGQSSNCGRTNKDGIDYAKSDIESFERYLALYHTPQESGGCKNCRFFLMCKGQCPGTAIDGDWRNRSEHCEVWAGLFEHLENQLLGEGQTPISLRQERPQLESMFTEAWSKGQNTSITQCFHQMNGGTASAGNRCQNGHGDSPHGDSHGDHTDTSLLRANAPVS